MAHRTRTSAILLNVTEEERALFAKWAKDCNRSRQDWMRLTLLWACDARKNRPKP